MVYKNTRVGQTREFFFIKLHCFNLRFGYATMLAPLPGLRVLSQRLRVNLAWGATETPVNFEVQRSRNPKGPFETLPVEFPSLAIYTDLVGQSRG